MTNINNGKKIAFDGSTRWYKDGFLHREEDLPAVEKPNGNKEWWIDGYMHRINGPAIIWSYGDKEWWLNDNKLSEKEFNRWLEKKKLFDKLDNNLPEKLAQKILKI